MSTPGDRPPPVDVRAQMRQQMLAGFGGWTGMLITAIPTVVFVIANSIASLRSAVLAAVASAIALTGYRLSRRQPTQQALNGLVGVVIAAVIAARTGQARGYFLVGIWSSFAYGGVFLLSILVRRPLVGMIWEFLDPTPQDHELRAEAGSAQSPASVDPISGLERPETVEGTAPERGMPSGPASSFEATPWYRRRHLASAYLLATVVATAVFAARGIVQLSLFQHNSTGWLAVARIAMGYPLTIGGFGFAWIMVRRARSRLRLAAAP